MCGDLYFPSTLKDDLEIYSLFGQHWDETGNIIGWHWIRISDEGTEGIWKDPENKENLTFTNWAEGSPKNISMNDHAVINYHGKWVNTYGPACVASEVLCELS